MGFLNKKYQYIDVQLTSYGRELLSKGIFRPKYFCVGDTEAQYMSSSYDSSVEFLPVFECLTDNVDVFRFPLYSNGVDTQCTTYRSNITGSVVITRNTDSSMYLDPIINFKTPLMTISEKLTKKSPIEVIPFRIASFKNRGRISDSNVVIEFDRKYSNENADYMIEVEISSSTGIPQKMLVSGSSFGISDDDYIWALSSSETPLAESFFEIIKIS